MGEIGCQENPVVFLYFRVEDKSTNESANIGYYVILESKKVGEKGIIYAVEPIKENFELLEKNISLNNKYFGFDGWLQSRSIWDWR